MINTVKESIRKLGVNDQVIIDKLNEYVSIESYTNNQIGVTNFCNVVARDLEDLGVETTIHKFDGCGPTLIGHFGSGDKKNGIILSGHMDTVFKDGFLSENPFRVEDGFAYGPGVLDMKGGIVLILQIIKILRDLEYDLPIKIILSGDEESAHRISKSEELFQNEAKGYKCAFNMETGLVDNGITIGRKGNVFCKIKSHGISSHSGANFDDGVSAIYDIANKVTAVNKLNEKYSNATFNVGIINGGTMPNSVPDYAEITIDVRFVDESFSSEILEDLNLIANSSDNGKITSSLELISRFPPFNKDINTNLYNLASLTSEENNFEKTYPAFLGGCSDAAHISIANVPCLCSMGMKGNWNHTNREYVLVNSGIERIRLITHMILKLKNMGI